MSFVPPPRRDSLKWLAVDFDDTLAVSHWSPDNPNALPGKPIEANVAELKRCVSLGWKIIIHTARPSSDYELIEAWLQHYKVPHHQIITGKVLAYRYIDDRNAMLGEAWV